MKVLETLSCENQVKELRLGEKTLASVSLWLSQTLRACLVLESLGERSMCHQGWYSCQLRRPKTGVCVLIFRPHTPFHHLPVLGMSCPVSEGKNDFWTVSCLLKDMWHVILLREYTTLS